MIHYERNVAVVVAKLKEFGYSPSNIQFNLDCYAKLKEYLQDLNTVSFTSDLALSWCTVLPKKKDPVRPVRSITRLIDVYELGYVQNKHIKVHGDLSPCFQNAISKYLESIQSEGFVKSSCYRIGEGCKLFCRFLQIQGTCTIQDIDYPALEQFHLFITDCEGSYFDYENYAARLLKVWAEQGLCRIGFSLYLHYAKFGKVTTVKSLSRGSQQIIKEKRDTDSTLTAWELYRIIPEFIKSMKNHGYSITSIRNSKKHLAVFCLFLDRTNLCYDRSIADAWIQDTGIEVFGSIVAATCSRTFDLFDDFCKDQDINPENLGRHRVRSYDLLPMWCKEGIDLYLHTKEREKNGDKSKEQRITICTRFCNYLQAEGLTAFAQLTPEIVKRFNLFDQHSNAKSKNLYNSYVRQFLVCLELYNMVSVGLHYALPRSDAKKEQVIRVLSEADKKKIDMFCEKAVTPLNLRDAAILRIAMDTGLRSCDIAALKFSNIDWATKCIRINQKKTNVEHIHPVQTRTLNAIYRYICIGRPKIASDHIFLTSQVPYHPISSKACRCSLLRANITETHFHTIRKTYATDMLKSGVTFAETAELLGHTSTGNVHIYTSLDEDRMRLCPFSLKETGLSLAGRYGDA